MHRLLIVDDDKLFPAMISDGLAGHESIEVVTARDGLQAKRLLADEQIDAVVTDLHMPVMDGFTLLAHIQEAHPRVKTLVMSGDFSPALEEQLRAQGCLLCLRKPFTPEKLAGLITELLGEQERGFLQRVSIPSFLQMLEVEKKTCTLEVTTDQHTGQLMMRQGVMVDARLGETRGEEAVQGIIAWEVADTIAMENVCEVDERTVTSELSFLIMEALRRKDEGARVTADGLLDAVTAPDEFKARATIEMPRYEVPDDAASRVAAPRLSPVHKANILQLLAGLREVHGYRGAALLAGEGEILVHDAEAELSLEQFAPAFQAVFRQAESSGAGAALGPCEEAVFRTAEAVLVLRSAPPICAVRYQLLVVLSTRGDEAPARALLKRAQPRITAQVLAAAAGK